MHEDREAGTAADDGRERAPLFSSYALPARPSAGACKRTIFDPAEATRQSAIADVNQELRFPVGAKPEDTVSCARRYEVRQCAARAIDRNTLIPAAIYAPESVSVELAVF